MISLTEYLNEERIEEGLLDFTLENATDKIANNKSKLQEFKKCLGKSDKSVKIEINKDGKLFIRGGICRLDLNKYKQIIPIINELGLETEYTLYIENFKGGVSQLGTSNWNVHTVEFDHCVLSIDDIINTNSVSFKHSDIISWTVDQKWVSAGLDDRAAMYLAQAYIDDHCRGIKMTNGLSSKVRKRGDIKI